MNYDDKFAWWHRRSFKIVGVFDIFCIAIIIAILAIPALAQTMIPLPGTNYIINLGDIPPWIAAVVVAATYFEARAAKKHAAEAVLIATTAAATGEIVRKQTDGLLEKIAASSKKEGKAEGKAEERVEVATAKELVRTDAIADAKSTAEIATIKPSDQKINKKKTK